MGDFERQLKKNGMLLKSIQSKERTEGQCKIAVHQNPRALKFVPYKLQSENLCNHEFVHKVMISDKEADAMNDKLITE